MRSILYALRYCWRTSKGYRLRPWASPYLRWRFETFFGIPAEELTAARFFQLLWRERRRLLSFLQWAEEIEKKSSSVARRPGKAYN